MLARAAGLILLVAFLLTLAGCASPVIHLPTPTGASLNIQQVTPEPHQTPQPSLLEQRLLVLEWPATVREKDSDLVVLTIAMDERGQLTATAQAPGAPGGTPVEIPNLYDTHNIVAVARLDMAGVEAYREDISQPLHPGEPVTFRWSIRANEPGVYQGVVWLRLELIPKKGGPTEERLLLARTIDIRAVSFLGLPADVVRILGGAGLVLSTLLGYPFIESWIASRFKKRKPKDQGGKPSKPASKEVETTEEK